MKRSTCAFLGLSLAAFVSSPSALAAEEGRFDAQVFRPLAAPRDLVMVPKTEVIGHLSPVAGVYWDAALNPLTLALGDTGKTLDAVGARLTITPLLGVGLFDWAELTMAVPFVTWQTSDNLRSIGTEGRVREAPGLGDIRLSTKIVMPHFNRKADARSGLGLAVGANINLPTGDERAFTSDGGLSGGAQIIADYRFKFGLLVASNLGVWIRPEHQFVGVKVGDMGQFGVAAEMYIMQRWGLSAIAELYGYPSLTKYLDDKAQVPAEALLGVRWQTRQGITATVGGSFGAACGFGAPALRAFGSLTWQPKSSEEQRRINRVLDRENDDPDHDGVLEPADKCPLGAGLPDDNGCPIPDSDADGVNDRDDPCPAVAAGRGGVSGCPLAYIEKDTIKIAEPIEFKPGGIELTPRGVAIVKSVVAVILDTTTIREVSVEVHTDVSGSDAESWVLSERRAESVGQQMLDLGLAEGTVFHVGYGHLAPEFDDSDCLGPYEDLPLDCKEAMRLNRRVVFRIQRWGSRLPREILGPNPASVLPYRFLKPEVGPSLLPECRPWTKGYDLPIPCVLPMKSDVLEQGRVLQKAEDAPGALPKGGSQVLPQDGVLPKGEAPKANPAP